MNISRRCRVVSTRLFFLLLWPLLGASLWAAEPPPASLPDASEKAAAVDRFGVQLLGPPDLQPFLLRHMELQRYRQLPDLDSGELDRLLLTLPDNVKQLLGTLGHFSAEVTVSRQLGNQALGDVLIQVEPGPPTRVASSAVYFGGDIAIHDPAKALREAVQTRSQQAVGQTFSQTAWDRTKSDALRLLTSERYPRARIANSLSDIDAVAHAAHWHLELDSGAPVMVGEVRVQGADRYDPRTVERLVRLAGLRPGTDYSLSRLQDAQQHIADTGYYSSVFAYMDLDAPSDTPAPVVVQVSEAQAQKVVLGVGGSTNSGPRLSAEHKHLRLPGIGWQAATRLKLERPDQSLGSDWTAPIEEDGWQWLSSGLLSREVYDTAVITGMSLSVGRALKRPDVDRRYFVEYLRERSKDTSDPALVSYSNDSAFSINHGWTWRHFDRLPYPQSGFGMGLTLGVGSTLTGRRDPFFHAQARWLSYWSLDDLSVPWTEAAKTHAAERPNRLGRIALRLQGGALLADTDARIPSTQLFLTGGDNTVRGYGLKDIGVPDEDGNVWPGRYMAVAGLEWQRPIWRDGVRTDWESVIFTDLGVITDQPSHTSPKLGVGAGLRYNSPVGPLQLDLAYGVDAKRFRIHLNVGFSF